MYLHEGVKVLVKVVVFDCKDKIADKWKEKAYRVLRQQTKKAQFM